MWKFNSPFNDFSKYFKKNNSRNSGPNKTIVGICWLIVILALIIAFLKIFFKVF